MTTKTFNLSDVLSITTGVLLSDRKMDGVCDILNFMTGEDLFTHQLVGAYGIVLPVLQKQFPQLTDVVVPKFDTQEAIEPWLQTQRDLFGDTFEVSPIPKTMIANPNPVAELHEMMSKEE